VKLTGVLTEAPMARTAATSATLRWAHVVDGSMFGLQRSISLVEPHAPSNVDWRARLPRNRIGGTHVGNVNASRL
jgi:hypothetical protein